MAEFAEILGETYWALGDVNRAHQQFERVRGIRLSTSLPPHLDQARAFSHSGQSALARHDYKTAEALFADALRIRESVYGHRNAAAASSLNDQGTLREAEGRDHEAERLYRDALDVVRATSGEQPESTRVHLDLGRLLARTGRVSEAKQYVDLAVATRRDALGRHHPAYADALALRAALSQLTGDEASSARQFDEARRIFLETFGPTHRSTLDATRNLAFVRLTAGRWQEALALAGAGLSQHMHAQADHLGHPRYSDAGFRDWIAFFNGVATWAGAGPSVVSATRLKMVEVALKGKAQTQDALAGLARDCGDPAATACLTLAALRQTWTHLSDVRSRVALQSQLDALLTREEQLLDVLADASPSVAASRTRLSQLSPQGLAAKLGHDEVLVDIVRYEVWEAQPANPYRPHTARYGALIIASGAPEATGWVDLGTAAEIDGTVATYRASMDTSENDAAANQCREIMRRRIWTPLSAHVPQRHQHWLVSPDGALSLWPWNVFLNQDPHGPEIAMVPSIDALLLARATPASSGPDLVRGASSFGPVPAPRTVTVAPGVTFQDRPMFAFDSLWHVDDEVRGVKDALGVPTSSGSEPLTRQWLVDEVASPRVLHLATQGFHLSIIGDAVLAYSGIALQNANSGAAGRLSAQEAAGLHLYGTQLVTLSACDTGAGDETFVDGVLGLQRALSIAGARSQLLALWRVDDRMTKLVMEKFYTRLARGERKASALRDVQLEIAKDQPQRIWAAFVLFGDPSPLQPRPGIEASDYSQRDRPPAPMTWPRSGQASDRPPEPARCGHSVRFTASCAGRTVYTEVP